MNEDSSTKLPGTPDNAIASKPNAAGSPASPPTPQPDKKPARSLPETARRALAEAEERRRKAHEAASSSEPELGGRGGLDPARFGDWEIKGRAIDF